ncbi:hypothetical protein JOD57_000858 [Geodermatophilus bullaregiensis]|uniref:hypothetical protein n=1 Tax=Geodermatophilus bullaregiensis TaxID=1564160 RepID=UPI0019563386|nr:hypothetical protein [Geodermatophilus bullaregiensis]MBM7805021.1 hypothetical protein [Geodermatophilus bullaregiensis]
MTAPGSGSTSPLHEGPPAGVGSGPSRNPASAVYGTVLAGSLIATEGARDSVDVPRMLVLVLVTQLVYWLAHVYADFVGQRIRTGRRPHRADVRELLREEWSLVAASYGPLIAVGAVHLLGFRANTACWPGCGRRPPCWSCGRWSPVGAVGCAEPNWRCTRSSAGPSVARWSR